MKIPPVSSRTITSKIKKVEDLVPLFVKEDKEKNLPKKKNIILPMLTGLMIATSIGGLAAAAGNVAAKIAKHEISLVRTFNTLTNAVLKTVSK